MEIYSSKYWRDTKLHDFYEERKIKTFSHAREVYIYVRPTDALSGLINTPFNLVHVPGNCELRRHQEGAWSGAHDFFKNCAVDPDTGVLENQGKTFLAELPTGTGKTGLLAACVYGLTGQITSQKDPWPNQRVLIVTPGTTINQQLKKAILGNNMTGKGVAMETKRVSAMKTFSMERKIFKMPSADKDAAMMLEAQPKIIFLDKNCRTADQVKEACGKEACVVIGNYHKLKGLIDTQAYDAFKHIKRLKEKMQEVWDSTVEQLMIDLEDKADQVIGGISPEVKALLSPEIQNEIKIMLKKQLSAVTQFGQQVTRIVKFLDIEAFHNERLKKVQACQQAGIPGPELATNKDTEDQIKVGLDLIEAWATDDGRTGLKESFRRSCRPHVEKIQKALMINLMTALLDPVIEALAPNLKLLHTYLHDRCDKCFGGGLGADTEGADTEGADAEGADHQPILGKLPKDFFSVLLIDEGYHADKAATYKNLLYSAFPLANKVLATGTAPDGLPYQGHYKLSYHESMDKELIRHATFLEIVDDLGCDLLKPSIEYPKRGVNGGVKQQYELLPERTNGKRNAGPNKTFAQFKSFIESEGNTCQSRIVAMENQLHADQHMIKIGTPYCSRPVDQVLKTVVSLLSHKRQWTGYPHTALICAAEQGNVKAQTHGFELIQQLRNLKVYDPVLMVERNVRAVYVSGDTDVTFMNSCIDFEIFENGAPAKKRKREGGVADADADIDPNQKRREQLLDYFRTSKRFDNNNFMIDILVHLNVLGEGFDSPNISVVGMLNNFASAGPMKQNMGRGIRKANNFDQLCAHDHHYKFCEKTMPGTPYDARLVQDMMSEVHMHVVTHAALMLGSFWDQAVADSERLYQETRFGMATPWVSQDVASGEKLFQVSDKGRRMGVGDAISTVVDDSKVELGVVKGLTSTVQNMVIVELEQPLISSIVNGARLSIRPAPANLSVPEQLLKTCNSLVIESHIRAKSFCKEHKAIAEKVLEGWSGLDGLDRPKVQW